MRGKFDSAYWRGVLRDVVVIGASLGACFLWLVKYYQIPATVAAQACEIQAVKSQVTDLHDWTLKSDGRMSRIEDSINYLKLSSDKQEGWLKSIASRVNSP